MNDFRITEEGRKKGDEAEFKFKEWLDKHNIPYFYIKQDADKYVNHMIMLLYSIVAAVTVLISLITGLKKI